jgi:phage-related protein
LNEGIFRDVVNKVKNFYNKVKDIVKRFYEKVIKRFIIKLYEIAKQGITVLLDTLGLDISNANIGMETPSW